MAWALFSAGFDFRPAACPHVTKVYRAGQTANVTRECLAQAKARGAAAPTTAPARPTGQG
jgi:hypothetical protein